MANEKIIDGNKERTKSFLERIENFITGEQLSVTQAKKQWKHYSDSDAVKLTRKHMTGGSRWSREGKRPSYLYEPYARYERTGNPDYKR